MKISNRQPHRSGQDQDSLRSHLQVSHDRTRDHRHRVEVLESVFDGLDGWKRAYVDLPSHSNSPPLHSLPSQDDMLASVETFATEIVRDAPVT